MEKYTSKKRSNSYKELARKVMTIGQKSNDTRFMRRESISINMSVVPGDHVILPLYRANGKKSSIKYALAESIWYASRRLTTELISKFGPIWKKMEDSKGLVNSNYGHQIFNNQNLDEKIGELVQTGKTRLFIVSRDNQSSRTDLVCNNAVDLYLSTSRQLKARVIARSIDLVYGYPYDVFAAQLFVRHVQNKIYDDFNLDTNLTSLRFDIENVHIYDKDMTEDPVSFETFDDQTFIVVSSHEVSNALKSIDYDKITVKDVEEIRDSLAESLSFEIKLSEANLLRENVEFEMFRSDRPDDLVKHLISRDDRISERQFYNVLDFINKDQFDRKNVVRLEDSLLYLTREKSPFGTKLLYEVSRYGK